MAAAQENLLDCIVHGGGKGGVLGPCPLCEKDKKKAEDQDCQAAKAFLRAYVQENYPGTSDYYVRSRAYTNQKISEMSCDEAKTIAWARGFIPPSKQADQDAAKRIADMRSQHDRSFKNANVEAMSAQAVDAALNAERQNLQQAERRAATARQLGGSQTANELSNYQHDVRRRIDALEARQRHLATEQPSIGTERTNDATLPSPRSHVDVAQDYQSTLGTIGAAVRASKIGMNALNSPPSIPAGESVVPSATITGVDKTNPFRTSSSNPARIATESAKNFGGPVHDFGRHAIDIAGNGIVDQFNRGISAIGSSRPGDTESAPRLIPPQSSGPFWTQRQQYDEQPGRAPRSTSYSPRQPDPRVRKWDDLIDSQVRGTQPLSTAIPTTAQEASGRSGALSAFDLRRLDELLRPVSRTPFVNPGQPGVTSGDGLKSICALDALLGPTDAKPGEKKPASSSLLDDSLRRKE